MYIYQGIQSFKRFAPRNDMTFYFVQDVRSQLCLSGIARTAIAALKTWRQRQRGSGGSCQRGGTGTDCGGGGQRGGANAAIGFPAPAQPGRANRAAIRNK
jgi:hypothetical protein